MVHGTHNVTLYFVRYNWNTFVKAACTIRLQRISASRLNKIKMVDNNIARKTIHKTNSSSKQFIRQTEAKAGEITTKKSTLLQHFVNYC